MKRLVSIVVCLSIVIMLVGCGEKSTTSSSSDRPEQNESYMLPRNEYTLEKSVRVNGRQGVCFEDGFYYVSGSTTITKYDKNWKVVKENNNPFVGYKKKVNHIGDIDVFNGELYLGVEYFMDGVGKNIQIAVYDADSLKLKRTFNFESKSGQKECSGITVNYDDKTVCMCSWVGEESGRYLYNYDLNTGKYIGKVHLQMPPQWIQGVAYYNGEYYMTADDGNADYKECDHLYRTKFDKKSTFATVVLERTFDDVKRQGEIEGISFDVDKKKMFLLYNRGAKIVLGMPKGFYPGYKEEISEVYTYKIN